MRVLLVEDNIGDAELVREMLARPAGGFEFVYSGLLRDALERLRESRFDVVLLDLALPDSTGIRTIREVRRAAPDTPVVVLSGREDEVLALEAVQRGAQDYLVKGRVEGDALRRSIRHAAERMRLVAALDRQAEDLKGSVERLKDLDRLKSTFLSTVSHELRTPLTAIRGYAQELSASGRLDGDGRECLDRLLSNARRLQTLVEGLLEYSAIQAGGLRVGAAPVEPAALLKALRDEWAPLFEKDRKRLEVAETGPLPALRGDPVRLRQLLDNLLSNALKFTPAGGRVRVEAAADEEGRLLRLDVRDTGPGVPAKDRERIFEPFTQGDPGDRRRFGGVGLGLAICREIVERHGGRIGVEEAPDGGSVFRVRLPVGTWNFELGT